MDRRQFHKTVLGGAAAALGLTGEATATAAAPLAVPLPLHLPDALPPGAAARFGNTRFCHYTEGGTEGAIAVAISPDGRLLAAQGWRDFTISLWEVPGGNLLRRWRAIDADRNGNLVFSPDGRLLAQACREGLSLWDPHTGKLVRCLVEGWRGAYGPAFSPDGRLLAGTDNSGRLVHVWEVATGNPVARFEADPRSNWLDDFNCVAFSFDGRLLAVGGTEHIALDSDSPEGKALLEQRPNDGAARKWSPAGRTVSIDGKQYVLDSRGRIWVWELDTGRAVARFGGHEFGVFQVAFLHDGRLMSYAEDGEVWMWDVRAGARLAEVAPSARANYKTSIGLAGDGRHALLSRPGYLGLIDLGDGKEVRQFPVGPDWRGWGYNPTVSADLRWVVTNNQGHFRLWDTATAADISPPARHSTSWMRAVRLTPDGRVVTATHGEVMLWDLQGKFLQQIEGKDQLVPETMALSPDGQRGACARKHWRAGVLERSDVLTWDWQTGETRCWEERDVCAIAWSADGESLVLGTERDDLYVLDLHSGRRERLQGVVPNRTLVVDGPGVWSVAVSADGRLAAAVTSGPTIRVWEMSGRRHHRLLAPAISGEVSTDCFDPCGRLAFSLDGQTIALVTPHGDVCVGPVHGPILPLISLPPTHSRKLFTCSFALAWLPTGRLLAAMSYWPGDDGIPGAAIRVFDVLARREVWAAPPFPGYAGLLAFSADGRQLVSDMSDGTAVRWPLESTFGAVI